VKLFSTIQRLRPWGVKGNQNHFSAPRSLEIGQNITIGTVLSIRELEDVESRLLEPLGAKK